MITLYLREHGTHNSGYSIDFQADLNNYNSSEKLLEDLFEYTKERLEEENYTEKMEEYIITDWELDENIYLKFNEYQNLDYLIRINNIIINLLDFDKKLISAYIEKNGVDFMEAYKKIMEDGVLGFDGNIEEYAEEMVENGDFGDIEDKLKYYIDYEKLARDLELSGYVYSDNFNISFYND